MPTILIDEKQVTVPEGTSILEAARLVGINIPTLCHLPGLPAQTSCFVCVVKVDGGERLLPACATAVRDGMTVESETAEVRGARRMALELLLSDHLGDCLGPCQVACPAHLNIPLLLRLVADGQQRETIAVIKEHIPLPTVMGHICPAFCERGCRRGQHDAALGICRIERQVAEWGAAADSPYQPQCQQTSGKRVAIIGAGPAGLSAAYYLQQAGHACVLFDQRERPGGGLREVEADRLPASVLEAEIASILSLGAEFRPGVHVGALEDVREFDAVLIATGAPGFSGLQMGKQGIQVEHDTMQTSVPGVFAAGEAVHPTHQAAIRAIADGQAAAAAIGQYLAGEAVLGGVRRPFSTHMGRLSAEELALQAAEVSAKAPGAGERTDASAVQECRRCLHCDCRKLQGCKLRDYAIAYGADPNRYRGERRPFTWDTSHPEVIYEPGKCIDCGLCVRITEMQQEPLGLAFIGRGFQVRPAVPFHEKLADGLQTAARECVEACPTGALAWKRE